MPAGVQEFWKTTGEVEDSREGGTAEAAMPSLKPLSVSMRNMFGLCADVSGREVALLLRCPVLLWLCRPRCARGEGLPRYRVRHMLRRCSRCTVFRVRHRRLLRWLVLRARLGRRRGILKSTSKGFVRSGSPMLYLVRQRGGTRKR